MPALVSGMASVWVPGYYALPAAAQHALVPLVAQSLAKQLVSFPWGDQRFQVAGVVLGMSTTTEDVFILRENEVDFGPPILKNYVVAAEGRAPGVRCEFGLYGKTASCRKWIVSFGPRGVEEWRKALGLPPLMSLNEGALTFCKRSQRDELRKQYYDFRKSSVWK